MTLRRPSTTLALALEDELLTAVLVNGEPRRLVASLAVNPLDDDPQLVAQELREHLQPFGRLPRRAVVCLPLNRLLVTSVVLPELPDDAVASYLRIQAEREFLLPGEELAAGMSRYALDGATRGAVLVGLPMGQHGNLRRALRLLGIRQVRIVPTATQLLPADGAGACIAIGSRGIDCAIRAGGGVLLLRRLTGTIPGAQRPTPDLSAVPGELRITLRQLPSALGQQLSTLRLSGRDEAVRSLRSTLEAANSLAPWRLEDAPLRESAAAVAAEPAATAFARGEPEPLALEPMAVARRGGFLGRWERRRIVTAAAVVVAVLLGLVGLVVYQQQRFRSLQREWAGMKDRVALVKQTMDEARALQPWSTDRPETLDIVRAVTEAFPERGTVWATRLEVRDRGVVAIAGKATSREAWLKTLDALRQTPGVHDLRVAQTRENNDGRSPLTFALGFTWQAPPRTTANREANR